MYAMSMFFNQLSSRRTRPQLYILFKQQTFSNIKPYGNMDIVTLVSSDVGEFFVPCKLAYQPSTLEKLLDRRKVRKTGSNNKYHGLFWRYAIYSRYIWLPQATVVCDMMASSFLLPLIEHIFFFLS